MQHPDDAGADANGADAVGPEVAAVSSSQPLSQQPESVSQANISCSAGQSSSSNNVRCPSMAVNGIPPQTQLLSAAAAASTSKLETPASGAGGAPVSRAGSRMQLTGGSSISRRSKSNGGPPPLLNAISTFSISTIRSSAADSLLGSSRTGSSQHCYSNGQLLDSNHTEPHDSQLLPLRQRRLTLPDIVRTDDDSVCYCSSARQQQHKRTASTRGSSKANGPCRAQRNGFTYLIVDGVRQTAQLAELSAVEEGRAERGEDGESSCSSGRMPPSYRLESLVKRTSTAASLPDLAAGSDDGIVVGLSREEARVLGEHRREELRLLAEKEAKRRKWQVVISFAMIEVSFLNFYCRIDFDFDYN